MSRISLTEFWLTPDQVHVTTLNDDEALINYAQPIVAELRANMVRADSDFSATPRKAKIAIAEQLRVHTMLVIGGRDPAARDRRGKRAPLPRRSARREAEGGSDRGYSGEHQRAKGVKITEGVRKYAAGQGIAEEEALKKGNGGEVDGVVEMGQQIYSKA